MSIQFIALIKVRHNSIEEFKAKIGWLSRAISSHEGWQMSVCAWQSPSPSPNDSQIVHVWDTPCASAMEARVEFNRILRQLDQCRLNDALSTMAGQEFLFTESVTYG